YIVSAVRCQYSYFFTLFFFHAPATTEIYTLSLHDALPISVGSNIYAGGQFGSGSAIRKWDGSTWSDPGGGICYFCGFGGRYVAADRKSTRLNSSHVSISYAVFCLKKKKKKRINTIHNTNVN